MVDGGMSSNMSNMIYKRIEEIVLRLGKSPKDPPERLEGV